MRRLRTFDFAHDTRGSAAAEMALVLPLLLMLMFGCLEGAHYLYVEHQAVKGVRDGARFASRQSFTQFACGTATLSSATIETLIKEVTRTGKVSGGASRVSGWDNADVSVAVSCPATPVTTGIYDGMTNAPRVVVSTSFTYPSLFNALTGIGVNATIYARQQSAVMGV